MGVQLNIRPQNECIYSLKYICAANVSNLENDACYGDSGGPLLCDNEVAGIVSFGSANCDNYDVLGHYTDVYAYREWILNNII